MNRKRFTATLACMAVLCLLLTTFSSVALATGETLISSKAGLKSISGGGSYRLTADIDLAGEDWVPLGEFSGTLDGGDHIIKNLTITDTTEQTGDSKGLFASILAGGTVSNLGIESANITACDNIGAIAGENYGTISRCYTTGTVSGKEYVGGIAGRNFADGTIENCYSRVSVSGTDYLGGLCGSNSGSVTTSYAASAVTDSVMNNYLQFNATALNSDNPSFIIYEQGGGVEIPHDEDLYGNINAFTLEAWFQRDNAGTVNESACEFIIGKGLEKLEIHTGGSGYADGLRFIPIPDNEVGNPNAFAGDSYIDVHNATQTGWFHVAAVYKYDSTKTVDNIEVQVYVNGVAQNLHQNHASETVGTTATLTRSTDPLADNNEAITIGCRTGRELYFKGKIADVRFWNTARTGDDIRNNKDKKLNGDEPGLVGYWKLDDDFDGAVAAGDEVDNSVTDGNNGTIFGSITQTKVSAGENKGALVGIGTVTDCYYDSTVYGSGSGGAGAAKTTAEMKTQATYENWDFGSTWRMESGEYPSLRFKTVSSVTVDPLTASVLKGATQAFSATVAGENSPAQTVNWTLEGEASASTEISADGLLTVGSDETATTLTVRATSAADTDKSGTAEVTVTPAPTVSSVTVDPLTASVLKGGTQGFSATVNGENSPAQTVSWTLEGEASASTEISADGLLSVGSDETAETLTVRATSTADTGKSGTATVTVTAPIQYRIIEGKGSKWTRGSGSDLRFASDADYDKLSGVTIDGSAVGSGNYTSESGSTRVRLKAGYLATLSSGRHTLRIVSTDGYAETYFTIASPTPVSGRPDTGVPETHFAFWLGVALVSSAGIAASFSLRRRQKNR